MLFAHEYIFFYNSNSISFEVTGVLIQNELELYQKRLKTCVVNHSCCNKNLIIAEYKEFIIGQANSTILG